MLVTFELLGNLFSQCSGSSVKTVSLYKKEHVLRKWKYFLLPVTLQEITALCFECQFINSQTLSDVKRMMNLLPATQREVVFMRFYQEMSFKEIAETTGVSINTSLGRMRYAIFNLRRMVREHKVSLQLT